MAKIGNCGQARLICARGGVGRLCLCRVSAGVRAGNWPG